MKPRINPQPIPQTPIRAKRLTQHRSEENRQRIIVPQTRHINRDFQPFISSLALPIATNNLLSSHLHISSLTLTLNPTPVFLDLRLYSHNRLCSVRKTHTRTTISRRQDVCFRDERAELCG
jgi:hypothetical protein